MKKTIIVVLYKQLIEESKTFQTLKSSLFTSEHNLDQLEIILYDNSPEEQSFDASTYGHVKITYMHDARNLGIATAYNVGWSVAKSNNSEWLLLFDHDTEITKEYVDAVMTIEEVDKTVSGIVPVVNCEGTMISPVFSHTLRPLQEKRPVVGIQEEPVMAINSGSLIRTSFLNEIGGFNTQFSLDYLDHWLFYEIYSRGNKVLLIDVTLEHELSVMDYSRVSLDRYESIIKSEMNFYRNYKKELLSAYRFQLLKRALKQALLVRNKQIAFCTFKKFLTL